MKKILSLLGFVCLALSGATASAGPTSIAQLPLLSSNNTGAVKPNLMLLYDNSGSMGYNYTPDILNSRTTPICRSGALLKNGQRTCTAGQPPFNSSDFNRQYYNPKVRYVPPVKSNGDSYPSMTSETWKTLKNDSFDVNTKNLLDDDKYTTIDLTSNFPDREWCKTKWATCVRNTATYVYPSNNGYYEQTVGTAPYYFTINVGEWCKKDDLKVCVETAVGQPAPQDYPVPAKVRWCSTTDLKTSDCQAKQTGNYIYPRFSRADVNAATQVNGITVPDYGSVTIGATASDAKATIDAIKVGESTGSVTITNGAVSADTGTNGAAEQNALAASLAASIIAKTGLTNQYLACVKTPPTGSVVPACSTYGITTLGGNNILVIIPVTCSNKAAKTGCTVVSDSSRNGFPISVSTTTGLMSETDRPTAIITVSGTSGNKTKLAASSYMGTTAILSKDVALTSLSAVNVASTLVNQIKTVGDITAYIGGNAVTKTCAAVTTTSICLVDTKATVGGKTVTMGLISTPGTGNLGFKTTASSTPPSEAFDSIDFKTATFGAGSAIFVRTNIVPEVDEYPKTAARTDCAGSSCTYNEEMTNFANWYTYYKTRNQMMKTAVGLAFQTLTERYNVGIVSLSDAAANVKMAVPKEFSSNNREAWYSKLYKMNGSGSTPTRMGLNSVGLMYANKYPQDYPDSEAAVQYACQQNFTFVTTDGYWNLGGPSDIGNNDNVENPARFCTLDSGCVDTSGGQGTLPSLADIALYWYNGGSKDAGASLRSTIENMKKPGLVGGKDNENHRLHMKTYTLGLGVDGIMNYEKNYDTDPIKGGDFWNLKNGVSTGCPWNNGGAYVWPNPTTDIVGTADAFQSRVDDLWHAAINGHGKYFSASDPTEVVASLGAALANIKSQAGAGAAATTSTPNLSQSDNHIFTSTFTTVDWTGELSDHKVDLATGIVSTTSEWTSSDTVGQTVDKTSDTRTIYMLDTADKNSLKLKNFKFSEMTTDVEQLWFKNKCTMLTQCAGLSAENKLIANDGNNIVNWLRGQQAYANNVILRGYPRTKNTPAGAAGPVPIVLGDIASSTPAYQAVPNRGYTDAAYATFKTAQKDRKPTVFVGANDGMLHAFNVEDGKELWAYVPRITMQKLPAQASLTYGQTHQFTVDGAPQIGDVKIGEVFRSVLVGGLNAGGRGFYALDVTNPSAPKALWELCTDASLCTSVDADLGLSFGNPQFGTWKDANGNTRWVVFLTSGYNNAPDANGVGSGDGKGYLYVVDAATGAVLNKTSTGAGDKTTPSGFTRITAISENPQIDPQVTYIYGGDNLGKMWRFDFTAKGSPKVVQMGDATATQPVTSRPEVTQCQVATTSTAGIVTQELRRMVVFGTGRLLDTIDIKDKNTQSVYVLEDTGVMASKSNLVKQTLTTTNAGNYKISGDVVDLSKKDGWYVDLDQNVGERVNIDPKVVAGTLNIVSNIPDNASACTVGGTSNLYQVGVCTAAPRISTEVDGMVAGGSLSDTAGAVGFIVVRLPDGSLKVIATGSDGLPITKNHPDPDGLEARKAGWRRVRD